MKITVKEMGISGAIIVGSGLLIGAISALCQKESLSQKKTSEESTPKKKSTPVVQMEVAFKSKPEKEPIQDAEQVKVITKEVDLPEQPIVKATPPALEEIEIEIATVTAKETPEKSTPKLILTNDDFPLQLGSKGARVFELQKYLLKRHGYGGEVTDEFDQSLADRVQTLLKVEQIDEKLFNKLIHKRRGRR